MKFIILDNKGIEVGRTEKIFQNTTGLQFIQTEVSEETNIDILQAKKIIEIKERLVILLAETNWRLERANERDVLGVKGETTETVKDVLSEREAIRKAGNRAESEVKSLLTIEEINFFKWEILETDYPKNKTLTQIQFLKRLTEEERIAITTLSNNNPQIKDYMNMLQIAKYVNLSDIQVIAGITLLEQITILDKGRAAQILAL